MDDARQDRLFANLASIAEDLVSDLDIGLIGQRVMAGCVELVAVSSAGMLVEDQHGTLGILASSSDDAKDLEMLELQSREGPCFMAFREGREVMVDDIASMVQQWPTFAPAVQALGVMTAAGVPLMLGGRTFGALNLFRKTATPFTERDIQLARLLCSIATVGIVHHRRLRDREELAEQLQNALDSRVTIEQAKGVVAARAGVSVTAAFELLRTAARASQRSITEVADDVVSGQLPAARLIGRATTRQPSGDAEGAERHT